MMIVVLLALALLGSALPEDPFAALDFEQALAKSKEEEKLLLIDFTASWCPPCHRMEKDTWGNDEVRAWLSKNAVSIQVDVDAEAELAGRFAIEAMPTVVAFRGGEEFDRAVGYKDAIGFLAWGRDVRAGKRSTDDLKKRARELTEGEDVQARYDLAGELLLAKEYDEALKHYLWLWTATRDTSMSGVRLSFMLGKISGLMKKHEPARIAFFAILEDLQAKVDAREVPEFDCWQEWSSMCTYFGETARMITWYEQRRDEDGIILAGQEQAFIRGIIIEELFEILLGSERYADAARILGDAVIYSNRLIKDHDDQIREMQAFDFYTDEQLERDEEWGRSQIVKNLSQLHGALLVIGRSEEAAEVAGILLQRFDDPKARTTLAGTGMLITKQPHDVFLRWLDEAEEGGARVRIYRKRFQRLQEAQPRSESPD